MPTFRYKGYRQDGRDCSGIISADNQRDARGRLKSDGILATLVEEDNPAVSSGRMKLRRGIGLAEIALMTRRLATLIGASMPIYEAATTLMEQERPGELRSVLSRVRDRLAEGSGLAAAFAQEGGLFSESYISMVAAGEASGALDLVLERLATFLEEQEALHSKVTTALAYPLLMIIVGCGVMLFLLGFVIPKITVVFADNKAALPLITVALIKTSTLVRKGWWLVLMLCTGAVILYRRLMKEERCILRDPCRSGGQPGLPHLPVRGEKRPDRGGETLRKPGEEHALPPPAGAHDRHRRAERHPGGDAGKGGDRLRGGVQYRHHTLHVVAGASSGSGHGTGRRPGGGCRAAPHIPVEPAGQITGDTATSGTTFMQRTI